MTKTFETGFDDESASPGLMLWRVTNSWQAVIRSALQPFGLTHVQFVLLASLAWLDGESAITQRELSDHARVDPMMTSQVVRTLAAKGLVERHRHPTDARARSLAVTPAGATLVNRANQVVEATDREFFARLGPEAGGFVNMLGKLDDV
ncbi:MarR family winged helix-turn-helix transcriptional regulator [Rhodococcus sp. 27YEA15]|uniref:MarR family winged helix-turn-helix transcriptional regulator n=1 Tax=Rhodococcus sp. 27YEA15 TaxID=3156259 RepID=UPI003C7C8F2B